MTISRFVVGGVTAAVALLWLAPSGPAATRDGHRVALPTLRGIVIEDRGVRTPLAGTQRLDGEPAWSPDGRRIALTRLYGADRDVVVVDVRSGEALRLTRHAAAHDVAPTWSPDGKLIAWARGRAGKWDIWVARADGAFPRGLVVGRRSQRDPAFSPDGRRLAYSSNEHGDYDIRVVPFAGGSSGLLVGGRGDQRKPAWSPGGKRVAYVSFGPGGRARLAVATPRAAGRKLALGVSTSARPAWLPDGSAIVYEAAGPPTLLVVEASGGAPKRYLGGGTGGGPASFGAPLSGPVPLAREILPDLDQRAPAGVTLRIVGDRRYLGFHSAVDNVGDGVLRIVGRRASILDPEMVAAQFVALAGGGRRVYDRVGVLQFEPHRPHKHWHFEPFERYELRSPSDHALVARDQKAGFCLTDRYGTAAGRVRVPVVVRFTSNCGAGRTDILRVVQGSSPGFTDRYPAWFHGQEIDVTDVPAGAYVLVHRANPDLLIHETRYDNNTASVRLRLTKDGRVEILGVCEQTERCESGALPLPAG